MAWDESKHPRDSRGRFARALAGAKQRGLKAAKRGAVVGALAQGTGSAVLAHTLRKQGIPAPSPAKAFATGAGIGAVRGGVSGLQVGAAWGAIRGPKKTKAQKAAARAAKARKRASKKAKARRKKKKK